MDREMKFVMSYSCGKDSTLALHHMLSAGHEAVGLLVMINQEMKRSWFHGVDDPLLKRISESLGIPLIPCACKGEAYHLAMEDGLRRAKEMGAQACAFGDIDLEDNATWCKERCEETGLSWQFPLWKRERKELVEEFLSLGYTALIKCLQNDILSENLLGKPLDRETVAQIERAGADACGENGEYHTVTIGGPIFRFPVPVECRETLRFGKISAVNIAAAK